MAGKSKNGPGLQRKMKDLGLPRRSYAWHFRKPSPKALEEKQMVSCPLALTGGQLTIFFVFKYGCRVP